MKRSKISFERLPSNLEIRTSSDRLLFAPLQLGGEWGLVASAVFKTVVSARKRRKVGSIPTRLRHSRSAEDVFGAGDQHARAAGLAPHVPVGCRRFGAG